jgi:hypothetical protein
VSAEVLSGGGANFLNFFFRPRRRLTQICRLRGGGGFKKIIFSLLTAAAA